MARAPAPLLEPVIPENDPCLECNGCCQDCPLAAGEEEA